jgi:hypothetical protein
MILEHYAILDTSASTGMSLHAFICALALSEVSDEVDSFKLLPNVVAA